MNKDRLYLESILECLNRIAEDTAANPDIPWRQIAGLHEVLIHDYLKVNLARVWRTVVVVLPPLRATVQQLLQS